MRCWKTFNINYLLMRRPIMWPRLVSDFCYYEKQNLFYEKTSPFQVLVIPALEQEAYGEFLPWNPGLGVFTLEIFSHVEKDSRVSIAWDQLKGRPVPQTHQEYVDSKQRLRAALRNLRTIEDVPSLLEIRVKSRTKAEMPDIKTEIQDIPVLPRRSRRKVKEKCMYNDDDSSESWTERIKPPRKTS